MIEKEDYLKAKQIVQEYEKQLNISVVKCSVCEACDNKICPTCNSRLIEYDIIKDNVNTGVKSYICSHCQCII